MSIRDALAEARPKTLKTARRSAALTPRFRALSLAQASGILARNIVGRLAYATRDRIEIEPIHYAYDGERLFGRTSPGAKLDALRHRPWVAFEVDEVEGVFDWRSVVVHGAIYILPADGSPIETRARRRAIKLLDGIVAGTGTAADPVRFRDVVFELTIDAITARAATSGRTRRTGAGTVRD